VAELVEGSKVKRELRFALDIAEEAGHLLLRHFGNLKPSEISYKGRRNVVTVADKEAEDLIVAAIRKEFPADAVLAEEATRDALTSQRIWVVDPLDGTVNFAHGVPIFCVSVALMSDGQVELGVVHAPVFGETWWALRGNGAFLNGKRCSVTSTADITKALLATGFAYIREETEHNNLPNFNRLNMVAEGVRRMGSAALDLCYVACGRYDGFWELFLWPWDVAAGSLIVTEAGGVVTDLEGGNDYIFSFNIAASNGRIHKALLSRLEPFPKRFRFGKLEPGGEAP